MGVVKLTTYNFRNLISTSINLHPSLNFFIGDNGSGKSSLLEAIFFIAHGKSFRTTKVEQLIKHDNHDLTVSVKDSNNLQLGLSKDINSGVSQIKINGENFYRLSELAKNIAVQIVTPESFKLFFGGPKERRRFVDLGMFHVKHDFTPQLREFTKVLKQRNACIKKNVGTDLTSYWTTLFCKMCNDVSKVRASYVEQLSVELPKWLNLLLPSIANDVSVQYLQGWPQKKSIEQTLIDSFDKEINFGYTLHGAHKFDVKFLLEKQDIESKLSRGQQKLFLLALTLAQARLISEVELIKPILLIDDLGAELDSNSRQFLESAISKLDCQVIITAIDEGVIRPFIKDKVILNNPEDKTNDYQMFHVKHGNVLPVNNSVMIE